MANSDDVEGAIIDAAMRLAAQKGWRDLSLREIADAAAVPLGDVRARFSCKGSILLAHARKVEREAAADPVDFDDADTARDRLFELLMHRLDLLAEHRAAVAAILRDLPRDPLSGLAAAPGVLRLMAPILDAAGVSSAGPIGILRCKGLAAIWLSTLAVWAADDSPDNARTMAALDRTLRRIEPVARLLGGADFGRPSSVAPGGF